MEVTIVIPCYNQAQYLPDAIESALNQTVRCEVIVVDDGSPDNTAEVAGKYITKGVRLIRQPNKGLSGARNSGIKAAKTEYVVTLDSDDKISPNFVEKCLAKIDGFDVVSTWLQTFGTENRAWGSNVLTPTYADFRQKNRINCCSLFTRQAWKDVGGYDESMKEGFEDWDFWRRLSRQGKRFMIIPEYLFFYRKHGRSMFTEAMEKRDRLIHEMEVKESKTGRLIDVVYVVGTGSGHNDQELRHSLRSLEHYMTGIRSVWIVGHRPRFVNKSVRHVPMDDNGGTKALNIWNKLIRAAQCSQITDEFLYINDDHFICSPVDAATYPNYYSTTALEDVFNRPRNDPYREITTTTMDQVSDGGFRYFDMHRPMRMNKRSIMELDHAVKFHRFRDGLLTKSMYGAWCDLEGVDTEDVIFRKPVTYEEIRRSITKTDCFSIHDEAVNPDMIRVMNDLYPSVSRWE